MSGLDGQGHGTERRVEFVGHAPGQLAYGRHFARLYQLCLRIAQGLMGGLQLGVQLSGNQSRAQLVGQHGQNVLVGPTEAAQAASQDDTPQAAPLGKQRHGQSSRLLEEQRQALLGHFLGQGLDVPRGRPLAYLVVATAGIKSLVFDQGFEYLGGAFEHGLRLTQSYQLGNSVDHQGQALHQGFVLGRRRRLPPQGLLQGLIPASGLEGQHRVP